MMKSIVTATLALGLVASPAISNAQEDSGHNSIGTSRASAASGRTREESSSLRTHVKSSKASKPKHEKTISSQFLHSLMLQAFRQTGV